MEIAHGGEGASTEAPQGLPPVGGLAKDRAGTYLTRHRASSTPINARPGQSSHSGRHPRRSFKARALASDWVAAATHQHPSPGEALMAGWSPQGRLTASAAPIELRSTLDPTTPPPGPKSAKGRQEKRVREHPTYARAGFFATRRTHFPTSRKGPVHSRWNRSQIVQRDSCKYGRRSLGLQVTERRERQSSTQSPHFIDGN